MDQECLIPNKLMSSIDHFDKVVSKQLESCNSAAEMLDVLERNFDLTQKLGLMSSLAFRQGLRTAVRMITPKIKADAIPN